MGNREEWATTTYTAPLSDDGANVLRVRLRVEHGVVVRFTVQHEAVIDGKSLPVERFDSAHGHAHQDTLDWSGKVVRKRWIYGGTYNDVVNDAISTIKAEWRSFREAFERRRS